jgi:AsmA protein
VKLKLDILDLARRQFRFELAADRLDLDHYFPPRPTGAPPRSTGAQGSAAAGAEGAPETPIDYAGLKPLNLEGTLQIGALVADHLKIEGIQAKLRAAGGRLDLAPFSARLYEGRLEGSARIDADSRSVGLREQLRGVALGPLLKDLADKDLLAGRASVDLDVSAAGSTVGALKRALEGKAALEVKDGALKGVNLGALARNASALLSGKGVQDVTAASSDKTDFTELTATFLIHEGVAHNSDLLARSPVVRLSGAGDIDIGHSRLDYTARATVVAEAAGQGAKSSGSAAGVSIPLRISGPFDQPRYQVDVQKMLRDAAGDQAGRHLEDALKKNVPPELQGPAGDVLKGLLGR